MSQVGRSLRSLLLFENDGNSQVVMYSVETAVLKKCEKALGLGVGKIKIEIFQRCN